MDLPALGEKALASPVVLESKAFFTTMRVRQLSGDARGCQSAQTGTGLVYALDLCAGGAAADLTTPEEDDMEDLTSENRSVELGEGIPSEVQPFFSDDGKGSAMVGTEGGPVVLDEEIDLPKERIYWVEE
jgi:hypothetical protein